MTERMITCCPACSTLFKVEPDQLRIAGGWVRCGQCLAVFDARTRMLPADPYVPDDLDWQEEAAAPPGDAREADRIQSQVAVDRPAGVVAPEAAAMENPPGPRRAVPAAEVPAFIAPAFELVPPPAPEAPAPMPVFIGKPPEQAAVHPAPAADLPRRQASPQSPLPIPTDDDLDRRYAKLLEALARLRENAENRPGDGDTAESMFPSDADAGLFAPDRESAPERQREGERHPRDPNRPHLPRTARPAHTPQPGADLSAHPAMDFVLSEISQPLPLPTAAPYRLEPEFETHPAQPAVPSFVELAQRRAFWSLPQVRAALGVTAGVLAVSLAAQIAISQRDWLAAHYPGATPLLQALCHPMRCQIAPWRHLGAMVMDSSPACVPTGSHGLNFGFTLRNGGAAPIATPALEVALTDALDQPLVRRILEPADWGAPPQLAGYGEFNGVALLTMHDPVYPQAVTKCVVEAFYP